MDIRILQNNTRRHSIPQADFKNYSFFECVNESPSLRDPELYYVYVYI